MFRDARMSDSEMNEFDYSIADQNLEDLAIQGYNVLNFLSWLEANRYDSLNMCKLENEDIQVLFQDYVDSRIDDLLDSSNNYVPEKLAQIPFNVVLCDENGNKFTYLKTQNNN